MVLVSRYKKERLSLGLEMEVLILILKKILKREFQDFLFIYQVVVITVITPNHYFIMFLHSVANTAYFILF